MASTHLVYLRFWFSVRKAGLWGQKSWGQGTNVGMTVLLLIWNRLPPDMCVLFLLSYLLDIIVKQFGHLRVVVVVVKGCINKCGVIWLNCPASDGCFAASWEFLLVLTAAVFAADFIFSSVSSHLVTGLQLKCRHLATTATFTVTLMKACWRHHIGEGWWEKKPPESGKTTISFGDFWLLFSSYFHLTRWWNAANTYFLLCQDFKSLLKKKKKITSHLMKTRLVFVSHPPLLLNLRQLDSKNMKSRRNPGYKDAQFPLIFFFFFFF